MLDSPLALLDLLIILLYFLFLGGLTWFYGKPGEDEESFLLSGRKITLPAMVATLVSTWYGGILGVGEYSYQFGISQWLLFGFPYYVFAVLFGMLLSRKIRSNPSRSIPEAIGNTYGTGTGKLAAIPIFLLVNPAPYILMLGLLLRFLFGLPADNIAEGPSLGDPTLLFAIGIALFSVLYVSFGGFGAVVRTDVLQTILMFAGFSILLVFAIADFGSFNVLWQSLPDHYRDLTGGHNIQYILVWFFIALWTFVDPGFHQRAAAAKDEQTAKRGIYVSVFFWAFFDFLTLSTALYGRMILGPDLAEPILTYPQLADSVLPPGLFGLFTVTLLATIMSTLDSFVFLAGQTIGRDLFKNLFPRIKPNTLTRAGILLSAFLAIVLIFIYPSVIDLWYVIGSVMIPGILIPVLGVYLSPFRLSSAYTRAIILSGIGVSLFWLILGTIYNPGLYSYAFLGLEPFYPGLGASLVIWLVGRAAK